VGAAFLDTIRNAASGYAAGELPANDRELSKRALERQGTRNELFADATPYSSGSDHDDYDSSTIAVPSLYLRDWPDIYIHTDHDTWIRSTRPSCGGRAAGSGLGICLCEHDRTAASNVTAVSHCPGRRPDRAGFQRRRSN
jgi:hypothetical protein